MLAPIGRALGRLADWLEEHVPVDLFDVDWPGDEQPTAEEFDTAQARDHGRA